MTSAASAPRDRAAIGSARTTISALSQGNTALAIVSPKQNRQATPNGNPVQSVMPVNASTVAGSARGLF